MQKTWPGELPFTLKYNTKKEMVNVEKNSTFYIGTAGARAFGHGDTINNLHCSEVSRWANAEQTMVGLLQAVPQSGRIIMETTANGFGDYFYNIWTKNENTPSPWMTKHNGKYYLQYGAPGTEFSGYADGVAVSDSPLGWFTHQSMPFSYKPGGFARGAGHGATFQDKWENYWHVSTIAISVKNSFERRLGLWPAGFDKDDVMYCNTAFGDYPLYLPEGKADHVKGLFTGWMILNYNKPVTVSSVFGGYEPNYAVDENIKTYWSAATGNPGEWISSDLGSVSTVRAIQLNYADQDATFLGKQTNIYHQFKLWSSLDGKKRLTHHLKLQWK